MRERILRGSTRRTEGLLHALFVLGFGFIMVLSAFPAVPGSADTGISAPAAIALTVAPATLPADGGSYPGVFVSLADQNGLPTLAGDATLVYLSSSQTSVGLILNSSVVIGPGKSYAIAYLRTTATPGQTTVTASSPGLKSSNIAVKTATPTGFPSVISLSAVPSQIPPVPQYPGTLIVQLQDSTGLPARAVSDTQVRLLSSNVNVTKVSDSVTIYAGDFSSTTSFSTGLVPGQAIITATSPGFVTGSTSIGVTGPAALGLKLFAQPDRMVTCSSPPWSTPCRGRLVVALTDQAGNPARAANQMTVQVRSSNLTVLQVNSTATIRQGDISAMANYSTTQFAGSAMVTVSAPALRSDVATVTTTAPSAQPTALRLLVGPNPVLADNGRYSPIVVSLVDKKGNPAVNSSGYTSVTITSSQNATGTFSSLIITIPPGQNFVSTSFTSTFLVGSTSITASAQNLTPAFASLVTTGAVPKSLMITPLSPTVPADGGLHPTIEITLQDSFGQPAVNHQDLTVNVSSDTRQVVQFNSQVTVPAGRYAVLVNGTTTTVAGIANITAYACPSTLQCPSPLLARPVLMRAVTPAPSAVVAYAVPSRFVLAKGQQAAELAVQLQDSGGNPARAGHETVFTMTSSATGVFNRTVTAKMAQGQDLIYLPLAPRDTGSTEFTVSSSGLASSSVEFTVLAAPIQLSLSPTLSTILQNQTDVVQLTLTFEGSGLARANVTWQATGGSVNPAASQTDVGGRSSVVFTPSASGLAKITALVSHPATGGGNLTTSIFVAPMQPRQQASALDLVLSEAPFIHVPYIVFAAAAAVIVLVIVIRRRRRVEEVVGEGYEGAAAS